MRVGSISADLGQFLFCSVERAGNYLFSDENGGPNMQSSESSIRVNVISHFYQYYLLVRSCMGF